MKDTPAMLRAIALLCLLCAPAFAQVNYPELSVGTPTQPQHATPRSWVDAGLMGKLDAANVLLTSRTVSVCPIGCDYPSMDNAFGGVRGMLAIAPFVTVTINPRDGVYVLTNPFYTAENLSSLRIVGNCTTPGAVTFQFTNIVANNGSAFVAEAGGRIGRSGSPGVDCVTLLGVGSRTNRSTWGAQSYGAGALALGTGSNIFFGPKMVVDSFYYSALADQGGRFAGNGATYRNAGDVNLLARFGGVVECQRCNVSTASDITTDAYGATLLLGHNILAEGGWVYADNAVLSDGQVACIGAQSNGMVWAHQVRASGCQGSGARVIQGGMMEITHAVFSFSALGAFVGEGGFLNADGAELHHNTYDGLQVDGGKAFGSNLNSHDNGGFGIRTVKQGSAKFYGTLPLLLGNGSGPFFNEIGYGCTSNAVQCSPPSTMILP